MNFIPATDIESKTCQFGSRLKDVKLTSIQKSKECDKLDGEQDLFDNAGDDESHHFETPIPIEDSKLLIFQFVPKHLMISYECVGKSNEEMFKYFLFNIKLYLYYVGGRRGHDSMVVGFTTTYIISAYHH